MRKHLRRTMIAQCAPQADEGRKGFAESFMLGEFACPDLVAFFQVQRMTTMRPLTRDPLRMPGLHIQSRAPVERNDIDIFNHFNSHKRCSQHQYPREFATECVCALRH